MRRVVRTYASPDGKHRLEILDNQNGFYAFEEISETVEHIPDLGPETFWTSSHCSGLYSSLNAAEQDAKLTIPWFRDNPGL